MNAPSPARTSSPAAQLRTLVKVAGDSRIRLLLSLGRRLAMPVYRASFLAGAVGSGLLRLLERQPADAAAIARELGVREDTHRLRVWLDVGVRLGELSCRDGRYALRSRYARALARPGNDALAGALQEVAHFHHPVLRDAPAMARDGRAFCLGDQDGDIIARSSLIVRPFVEEAVSRHLERDRPVRLLEVGCGTGHYVRHAARLNPRLTALAVDLQPEVAARAGENMARWGLADRVRTRQGDLRKLDVDERFDLLTLHNNIYYFPEDERTEVLGRARELLATGGRLLLTTSCQGGSPALAALNLWFEYADFGGPLPHEDRLLDQMREAGFAGVGASRIVPGEQFRAFTGTRAPDAH
ncbi:SAM-dependent methyltransferase [Streptomyces albus]|uniref:SAM-dependent methyltransferase n=1 Tax=Streptomyces albus TaxID=1888 RepID=UPI0037028F46